MSLHKEINFENDICQHLASNGWLYVEGDAATYDRARALFPGGCAGMGASHPPQAWEILVKNHGDKAGETLLARLRDQLDQRGTLDVLRHGIELLGLKQPLQAGTVQTGTGDQSRHSRPLCRQPAARGAAGTILAAQRELH